MADILAIRPFRVDITPPLGDWICGGMLPRAETILEPLWLRGLLLHANGTRYIIAVIDMCYLCGRSQERLEQSLADAAAIPRNQVVIQSNHTHAAPMLFEQAQQITNEFRPDLDLYNQDYVSRLLADIQATVSQALQQEPIPVQGVGFSSHPVKDFASTRRVKLPDGSIGVRWSFCRDHAIRQAPEGLIDPLLDQVTFWDANEQPVAALSFFACHPQAGYLGAAIHGDTLGVAMSIYQQTHPTIAPMHFDGCGGDVTVGKYFSGNGWRERLALGIRLFDAMEEATLKSRPETIPSVIWHDAQPLAPLAPIQFTEEQVMTTLRNPDAHGTVAYLHAIKLLRYRQQIQTYPFRLTRLVLGDINLLFLPSELVVDYQLHAKHQCQGKIAVAAYGDSFLNYVATDRAFQEGGYEVEPIWTEVGPGIEGFINTQISQILSL